MNWRSLRIIGAVVVILIILGGGSGFLVWYISNAQQYNAPTRVYPLGQVPTPSSTRTTYTNKKYGYSFIYPSSWKLRISESQGVESVSALYQVNAGDSYPFQADCQANPRALDAQAFWQQENTNNSGLAPIGYQLLKNGEKAFVSVGHGQNSDTVYTLVHSNVVCELDEFGANIANTAIIEDIVNSFQWN